MRVGLHGAPSSGQHHAPHSRRFGPQPGWCLAGLCSLGTGGEGAGSHQPSFFRLGGLSAPSVHRPGALGMGAARHPPPVMLNPELTCEAGMEQSSVQPPPLWPFLCHGLLLKAWFL